MFHLEIKLSFWYLREVGSLKFRLCILKSDMFFKE